MGAPFFIMLGKNPPFTAMELRSPNRTRSIHQRQLTEFAQAGGSLWMAIVARRPEIDTRLLVAVLDILPGSVKLTEPIGRRRIFRRRSLAQVFSIVTFAPSLR